MSESSVRLDQFQILRTLGEGASSKVYEVVDRSSGFRCVLKQYRRAEMTSMNKRQVNREIDIHASLDHPHIIHLYAAFQTVAYTYLVLEAADGGDLFHELTRRRGVCTEQFAVQSVLAPLLDALRVLHGRNISHRDIKPENLLLQKTDASQALSVRLADFGLAIDSTEERPCSRVGTIEFMAPEVLLASPKPRTKRTTSQETTSNNNNKNDARPSASDTISPARSPSLVQPTHDATATTTPVVNYLYDGASADVWAMGVLAAELLAGRSPFARKSRQLTRDAVLNDDPLQPGYTSTFSEDAIAFISAALHRDPKRRPTVVQLMSMPWIQKLRRGPNDKARLSTTNRSDSYTHSLAPPSLGSLTISIPPTPSIDAHRHAHTAREQLPPLGLVPSPQRRVPNHLATAALTRSHSLHVGSAPEIKSLLAGTTGSETQQGRALIRADSSLSSDGMLSARSSFEAKIPFQGRSKGKGGSILSQAPVTMPPKGSAKLLPSLSSPVSKLLSRSQQSPPAFITPPPAQKSRSFLRRNNSMGGSLTPLVLSDNRKGKLRPLPSMLEAAATAPLSAD